MKITLSIPLSQDNPVVFIEANIHAREWITSATATWFLNQLLTSTNPAIQDLAQNINWYIVPVFNVDGFVYSHEVVSNELTELISENNFSFCHRTDCGERPDSLMHTSAMVQTLIETLASNGIVINDRPMKDQLLI